MSWLPAIASIASSIMQSQGQEDTNDMNLRIQQQNSAFNAEQAQLNRDFSSNEAAVNRHFQKQQADSVWQRGVADMQAAGLNPMLAYSQGGNPAPQGAMGQGSAAQAGAPGNAANPYAAAAASAGQWAQIERTQAETDAIRADTRLKDEDLKKKPWEIRIKELESDIKVYEQRAESARDNYSRQRAETELEYLQEQARAMKFEAEHKRLELPRAINEAAAEGTAWKRNVSPFLNDASKLSGASAAARRGIGGFHPAPKTFNIRNYR